MRAKRALVGTAIGLVIVGVPGWFWFDSLLPDSYSAMEMGYPDYGGGPIEDHSLHGVSVADLIGDVAGVPDVAVTLVARAEQFTLLTGERLDGYTLNHTSPGPVIRADQGELIEVTLVNESVTDGVSLHWHGVDLPGAQDGVAGVTQDAVRPGGRYVYRFRADDSGTYWYHSHQRSRVQVPGGLYGVLIIEERQPDGADAAGGPRLPDVVAAVHSYGSLGTISGRTGLTRVPATPGSVVRLRVVNTEPASVILAIYGTSYRVLAIDGRNLNGPTELRDRSVSVPGGGRIDLAISVPQSTAARVDFGTGAGVLVIGPESVPIAPLRALSGSVDFLNYGLTAPIGFDASRPDRRFTYTVDRRFGFLNGRPGSWWTVNGRLYPDLPMFMVREGDVAVMTITNSFGSLHPMHLHGHHAVVLERNGVKASGSPWWVDTLDVEKGATYVIAFLADNPGIWMDHCHNLTHAAAGLVAHVAYIGVSTPFRIGGESGNTPE